MRVPQSRAPRSRVSTFQIDPLQRRRPRRQFLHFALWQGQAPDLKKGIQRSEPDRDRSVIIRTELWRVVPNQKSASSRNSSLHGKLLFHDPIQRQLPPASRQEFLQDARRKN